MDDIGWTNDMGNYDAGWIKASKLKENSAWIYRSIPITKYFGLCMYYSQIIIICTSRMGNQYIIELMIYTQVD